MRGNKNRVRPNQYTEFFLAIGFIIYPREMKSWRSGEIPLLTHQRVDLTYISNLAAGFRGMLSNVDTVSVCLEGE